MKTVLTLLLGACALVSAQSAPDGKLTIDGTPIKLTRAYAFSTEGFFDKDKNDTVLILADRPLTDAQMRDGFALRDMAKEGKLAYVQETIDASGQIVSFLIGHKAFKALPSGGSTEHVFEGKQEGGAISGKVRTKGEQEFFGTKYEYDATFRAPVQPKQ